LTAHGQFRIQRSWVQILDPHQCEQPGLHGVRVRKLPFTAERVVRAMR
jgi:hypothetical protein